MSKKIFPSGSSIAIIGAGVVGVANAYALAQKGYQVTVYDVEAPGEAGPSRGNAGHIGASDIYPLSSPGIHWKALKMLCNPEGPLKIPISSAIAHVPWFWRFWRTSQAQQFKTATQALHYLGSRTISDTQTMLDSAGMTDKLSHNGCAFIYDNNESFMASKPSWADRLSYGYDSEEMNADRISREIPVINKTFRHAVLSKQWSMVNEPLEVVRGLAKAAESNHAIFMQARVNNISEQASFVSLETDKGTLKHEAVIIAAGINSTSFAKKLNDFLPMVAERGYNLTVPNSGIELNLPLAFVDRGVVATQLTSGLRIGGWAEYTHPNRPANKSYFKSMARIGKQLFPDLTLDNANFWMGNRPSMPDSVPVISASAQSNKVFYNCGHGHYGLTHAATSAHIICNLLSAQDTSTEYKAYSINRFK